MNRVVHVSSNANNGTNAGTFIVNANNDSSNRNRNIGTHLAVSSVRTKMFCGCAMTLLTVCKDFRLETIQASISEICT
jgi:hypothetical protein